MPQIAFFLVDVFTREPLAGNPLALVADADDLDLKTMQRLGREFNQSETTFLLRPTRPAADWRLRFFTPTGAEVFGAGHNALGAWWWLAASGRLTRPADSAGRAVYAQQIGERVLPVEIVFEAGTLAAVGMIQDAPVFGARQGDRAALASALRIRDADLQVERLVPQVVSTGAAHLLVPVRDRAAVDGVRPDAGRLVSLLGALGGQGCYVFCLDPIDQGVNSNARGAPPPLALARRRGSASLGPQALAYARFFNPAVGISEDPATGSAAGPLGCYLIAHGVHADGTAMVVEQGYAMGRPSRIDVLVRGDVVRVSGSAVVVAEGTLRC